MSEACHPTDRRRSSAEEEILPGSPHESDSPADRFQVPSLPEGAGLKPHLDSIFADVQASLPSIDFELSDASSDEDVQILSRSTPRPKSYKKRHQPLTDDTWHEALSAQTTELAEEMAYEFHDLLLHSDGKDSGLSSSGSSERNRKEGLKDVPKSSTSHGEDGHLEEEPGQRSYESASNSDSLESQSADDTFEIVEEIVGFKNTPLMLNFDEKVVRSPQIVIDENANVSSQLVQEETDTVADQRSSVRATQREEARFESYIPSGVPHLETGPIDHIDLDLLLDAFPERNAGTRVCGEQRSVPRHGEGDVKKNRDFESLKLMKQLAQLCVEQSEGAVKSEDLDGLLLRSAKHLRQVSNRPVIRSAWTEEPMRCKKSSEAAQDLSLDPPDKEPSPSREASTQTSEASEGGRKTIYLDLRTKTEKPDSQVGNPEAIRRILHLRSPSDSSSSSDDDSDGEDPLVAWHAHRRRALEKARQVKGHSSEDHPVNTRSQFQHPTRVIPLYEKKHPVTKTSVPAKESVSAIPPTPAQTPASVTPKRKDSNASKEHERRHRAEVVKRLREQREAERQSRLRLQGQLAAMRPVTSGKVPAPQGTPIIFDIDSSYSIAPEPLPPFLQSDNEVVLLTARLNRAGEISPAKGSDNPQTTSATYHVFLSLLFSLIPTNFDFIENKASELLSDGEYLDSIPFRVVGIQQVSHEDSLTLHVGVVPKIAETSPFFKSRARKQKKSDRPAPTSFQKILTRFLAANTLQNLCPWLNELSFCTTTCKGDVISGPPGTRYESCLDDGTYLPSIPQPSTRPLETFVSISPDPGAARRMFVLPLSFFWGVIPSPGNLFPDIPGDLGEKVTDVQTTMSLIYDKVFVKPQSMMGILQRVFQEGLEVAGLRLLYQDQKIISNPSAIHPQQTSSPDSTSKDLCPVLALALRGNEARSVWLDSLGPTDPVLAQRTDPQSVMANYGGTSREDLTIYCPRNPNRINYELSYWFGGRIPADRVVDLRSLDRGATGGGSNEGGRKKKKGSKKGAHEDGNEEFQLVRTHVSTLVATTPGDVFLTVAPLVPPVCLGIILSVCHKRGFLLCGVKRMRLNLKRATSLGLSGSQLRIFSPVACTTPTSPKNFEDEIRSSIESGFSLTTSSPMPSTILLLRKENALHHACSLQESLMNALGMKGILSQIQEDTGATMTSDLCFHVTPYSDNLLAALGGDFNRVPSYERFASSSVPPSFYSSPELEQIVVIAFTGWEALKGVGNSLGVLLGISLVTKETEEVLRDVSGLEFLGLKLIPSLTTAQAKELTPFEVGSRDWQSSVQCLSSKPSLICILRGVNAFQRVKETLRTPLIPRNNRHLQIDAFRILMSMSPEIAYRQAAHFFRDHELFADPGMRENLRYFPPLRSPSLEELSTARFSWAEDPPHSPGGGKKSKRGGQRNDKGTMIIEESIFKTMLTGPRLLTTVLLIKPFGVQKHFSKILKRVLQEDFTIVAMRMLMLSPEQTALLVPSEARANEIVSSMHISHLTSGPCLALCLLRENAVKKLLDLLGPQNPVEAKQANQFYWRGLYGDDMVNNALHGSESYASAVEEIKILFPDGLSHTETPDLRADQIAAPGIDLTLGLSQASKRHFSVGSRTPVSEDSSTDLPSTEVMGHTSSGSCHSSEELSESLSISSMGVSASLSDISLPSHSALCQTNCLLLTPLLQLLDVGIHRKGYVEVIDALLSHGFDIVGIRMFWFTKSQAEEFLTLYHRPNQQLSKILCHGPCIVLAVQRDNAVNCFETALGSNLETDSIINKYGSQILRPNDTAGAEEYLTFFFDELMPLSQGYITDGSR